MLHGQRIRLHRDTGGRRAADHEDAKGVGGLLGQELPLRLGNSVTGRRLSPSRRMQWPYLHHLRSMLEQRLGNAVASAQEAEKAVIAVTITGHGPPRAKPADNAVRR